VFDEFGVDISPDGKWIAYVSDESGRNEVYVRQFADPGAGRVPVSVDGADEPLWAHNGRELFFRSRRGEVMVSEVSLGTSLAAGQPRALSTAPNMATDPNHRAYDISRDDQRFVMINRSMNEISEVVLVLNWYQDNALPVSGATLPAGQGREEFSTICSRCHALPDPMVHGPQDWLAVYLRMEQNMERMNVSLATPAESSLILAYLQEVSATP